MRLQSISLGVQSALYVLMAGTACAAPASVEVLKQMPPKGSVRQGDVVYVDDGRCPAGEVTRITGGNQQTGVARQVECVKRPPSAGVPKS
ncbi:hypothetical protein H6CHR_01779 [Variovorax sp. PBL-H6]|uniref:DUF6719 family protein n=1 Tax=Variovorax sp. PBL-H6 TaxID=434009 RepID=UPI001315DC06|nr:hypothetical protein H6CHR_01779 [Variovorax sp. PBL-H6]